MEQVRTPESGDLYRHIRTQAYVIVLTIKQVAGDTAIRLGRFGHDTPMETDLDTFRRKFEWLGINVLSEKARLDETGIDSQQN